MTQAWNLSQLANKVNTSGQLDVSTGASGTLPIANGGTNNASLAVTAGGILYTDGAKQVNTGAGTSGYFLQSNGASAPTWALLNAGGALNNIQYFLTVTTGVTYTATSGTNFVIVEVLSGGGGGGGHSTGGSGATGAGGSGAYGRKKITSAFNGVIVVVGGGGAGSTSTTGGAGGASGFGSLLTCTGGAGGVTASQTAGTSGSATGADFSLVYTAIGINGSGSFYGNGGIGNGVSSSQGANGTGYGSSGGGANYSSITSATGGNGTQGLVIVYEYK